jgi:hypothetical protein
MRNGFGLDGCGCVVAFLGDGTNNGLMESEIAKCHRESLLEVRSFGLPVPRNRNVPDAGRVLKEPPVFNDPVVLFVHGLAISIAARGGQVHTAAFARGKWAPVQPVDELAQGWTHPTRWILVTSVTMRCLNCDYDISVTVEPVFGMRGIV